LIQEDSFKFLKFFFKESIVTFQIVLFGLNYNILYSLV